MGIDWLRHLLWPNGNKIVGVLAAIAVVASVPASAQPTDPASSAQSSQHDTDGSEGRDAAGCSAGEVLSLRARDSKTVQNADCSYTAIFEQYTHYEAEPGRWEDVDLRFHEHGPDWIADHHDVVVKVAGATVTATDRLTGQGIRWVTPGEPSVSGRKASFSHDGLQWSYFTTKPGLKLVARVSDPRGAKTYSFPYALVGDSPDFTVDAGGNLRSGNILVPRAGALGADGKTYEAGGWRLLPGNRVAFDFDDSLLPVAAFPYDLDPTTTFEATSSPDTGGTGQLGTRFTSYPPACERSYTTPVCCTSAQIEVERTRWTDDLCPNCYRLSNGLVRWNTSALPDTATIRTAKIEVGSTGETGNHNVRNLTADWYRSWPIDCADHTATAQTSAVTGIPLKTLVQNYDGYMTIPLDNTTGVSRSGLTGVRFHVSGGQFFSYESNKFTFHGYGSTDRAAPRLIVTYGNAAPTISSVSDSPDPVAPGSSVTFSAGWSDADGDPVRAVICKTNSVSAGSCPGGSWTTGGLSSTSPAGASYTTSSNDVGTQSYYAFACDQFNACSSSLFGTFTVKQPNAAPTIESVWDGPDPVVRGQSITFSVSWGDSNGDSAKTLICKTNSVFGSSCAGGAWAESGSFATVSPTQVTYTTSSADLGTRNYFAFVCDSAGACAPSIASTFVVSDIPPHLTPTMSGPSGQSDADGHPVVRDGNTLTFSGPITQGAGGPPDSGASVTNCDLVVRNTSGLIVNRIAVPTSGCRNSNGTLHGSYAPSNLGASDGSVVLEVEVTRNATSSGVRQSNPLQVDNAIPVLSAATIGCFSDVGGAMCQERRSIVVDFSEPIRGGFMTSDFSVSSNSILSVGSECNSTGFCDEVTLTLGVAVDETNPPTVSYSFFEMMGRSRPVDAMGFSLPNAFYRSRVVASPASVDQAADIYASQQQTALDQSPDGLVQIVNSNVLQSGADAPGIPTPCPPGRQDDEGTPAKHVRCDPAGRARHFAERIVALANKGLATDDDGMAYAPDIIPLQEVRTRDAREIAGHLNSRVELGGTSCTQTPRCYRVAISYESADASVKVDSTDNKIVTADTAILYNRRSLQLQNTGMFSTAYTRREKCVPEVDKDGKVVFADTDLDGFSDCEKRKVKRHFMARFIEAPPDETPPPTDLEIAVASIHFVTNKHLKNGATHAAVKDRWAQKAANKLRMLASPATSAPSQLFVLGGDFNIGRCGDEDLLLDDDPNNDPPSEEPTDPVQCQERAWWQNLTGATYQYDDSVYVRNRVQEQMDRQYQSGSASTERRIDFIFVRNSSMTEPTAASRNFTCGLTHQTEEPDERTCHFLPNVERYSDHLLDWSLAGR